MRKTWILAGSCTLNLMFAGCMMESQAPAAGDAAARRPTREQIKSSVEEASKTSTWIHCREFPNGMREAYSLGVLNKKLEYLPQVSERLGTRAVSTCDEARRFMEIVQEDPANELIYPDDYADLALPVAPPAAPAPDQDATHVLPKKALAGATLGKNKGTVMVQFNHYGEICGGALLNSRAILTSAHCADQYISGTSGYVYVDVRYYDPYDASIPVGNYRTIASGTMLFTLAPTFAGDGDTESDIAVITSSVPWLNTSSRDYLGMYYDTMSDARYNTIWGTGTYGDSDMEWDAQLRYEAIYLDWYGEYHLYDEQYNYRLCAGDSGGPLIRDDSFDIAVTGVASNTDPRVGNCGEKGTRARWTRVSSKALWVQDVLRTTGVTQSCSIQRINEGNRRQYMQCF